jgi:predicted DCC family thiol-disulfide oxidoreductase YuxK
VRSTSSSRTAADAGGALLLYDGTCGLCAASVQFVLRHERRHSLRFASLDSDIGAAVRARHPAAAGADSMVWVETASDGTENILLRSAAAVRLARYIGGPWSLLAIGSLVPRFLRDAVYDVIARHRHQLVSADQCFLPPSDVRARFLA